jgi:prophage maintenance system killer protein
MAIVFLTVAEIIEIHRDVIDRYGGGTGMRDIGLLESAASNA